MTAVYQAQAQCNTRLSIVTTTSCSNVVCAVHGVEVQTVCKENLRPYYSFNFIKTRNVSGYYRTANNSRRILYISPPPVKFPETTFFRK